MAVDSSNSCSIDLLLVHSKLAQIIIIKCFIPRLNNMNMQVEPISYDHACKDNALNLLTTQPKTCTLCNYKRQFLTAFLGVRGHLLIFSFPMFTLEKSLILVCKSNYQNLRGNTAYTSLIIVLFLIFRLQNICLVFQLIVLFLELFNTTSFQAGFVGNMIKKFRVPIIVTVIYLALSIGLHVFTLTIR